MKKGKRLLASLLSLILAFALAGCSAGGWNEAQSLIDELLKPVESGAAAQDTPGDHAADKPAAKSENKPAAGKEKPAAKVPSDKPKQTPAETNKPKAVPAEQAQQTPEQAASAPEETSDPEEEEAPRRIEVVLDHPIDGDTIAVKIGDQVEKVRFLLIDTPETNHPTHGVQPFGPEAKEFTSEKVQNAQKLELEFDVSERDKYGRLLAYVYVDGESLQEMLLAEGLARVAYVYPPNVKYVDRYREIQKEAQKKGIGIWSIEDYARDDGFHPEVVSEG